MSQITSLILPGAKAVRNYAERLTKDIPADVFCRTPVVAGKKIEMNHPAFNLGHLALYPQKIAEFAKQDVPGTAVPATYSDLFKDGVVCQDDPNSSIYPKKDELVSIFLSTTDALLARFSEFPESAFSLVMEDPKRRERFPTVGAFISYLLLAHPSVHLGQISAWRRCMGLGAV